MAQPSKRRHRKRGAAAAEDPDLERLNSLPWNPSFSGDDDPFSLPIGSNDLEGGFLSLEEIDDSEYGLGIPKPGREDESDKPKAEPKKKRKRDNGDGNSDGAVENDNGTKVEEKENAETGKKKRQKRKKKKKVKKSSDHAESMENIAQPVTKDVEQVTNIVESVSVNTMAVDSSKDKFEGESADEAEFHAWGELRLHPLLMRSIYKLGFKEPTPIQRACIPAAAHQGKDVVGAAETGSGKTLAFGLPILQRLIEEWEKSENEFLNSEKVAEKYASGGFLRALIVTPTRELALQVTDHLKAVAVGINVRVVPIVGGMSTEKQERLLRARPEIVVGTPGRLWELMSGGESHLTELHSLSFFVLDEADRMVENGHFHELQSIIDMLPMRSGAIKGNSSNTENCVTVTSFQRKKRQTFVFSATIALSADFRKKLKRGSLQSKQSTSNELNSIETLSERAGMRENAAIVDLTNASIMANKLEESFIECREEEKDAYLYYILSVHGQGRTLVFCTSIAALRHTSSLLRILNINVWTLHAQMQQRARLKAIDRFRGNEHGILVATDVAARGLDIPNVRTIVHYQLPHSAEVYVHRSGRTARAASDGCSIALISPNDRSKFASLCKSFSKESFQQFPLDSSYIPEVLRRLSLARQIDKILRKDSQDKAEKNWFERNAESVELVVEEDNSEEEKVNSYKKKKASSVHLKKLQQELCVLLSRPLQPRTFSRRFLAGAGVSPVLQQQFEELARQKLGDKISGESKRRKLLIIGQDCVEPLQALRSAGHEVHVDLKAIAEKRRNMENTRRKRRDEKKRLREQRRKQRKKQKGHSE